MSGLTTVVDLKQVKNFASFQTMGDVDANTLEHNTEKGTIATERQKKKNTVCVSIRTRPTNAHEQASAEARQAVWVKPGLDGDIIIVEVDGVMQQKGYDNGFYDTTQEEVFDVIGKPMLKGSFFGFNVTIFAYGQTGAGKTFSTMGKEQKEQLPGGKEKILGYSWGHAQLEGFVPRFIRHLLRHGSYLMKTDPKLSVKLIISAMQVYLEDIQDLLEKKVEGKASTALPCTGSVEKGFQVQGLSYHAVDTEERAKNLIEACLKGRALGSHNMNNSSSRSHCIMGFRLLQMGGADNKDKDSQIYIVDLAGSERIDKVGVVAGSQMAKEANFINSSLTTLRMALEDVAKGKKSGNIRNSKLTMILCNSFGGSAKTWMLCCASPAKMNALETFSTLNFADIVKKIVNVPKENVKSKKEMKDTMAMVSELQETNASLQALNEELENQKKEMEEELRRWREGGGSAPAAIDPSSPRQSGGGGGGGGPVQFTKADLFIGRATLSLANCVLGKNKMTTLPLETQPGQEGALLSVSTYCPEDQEGQPWPTFSDSSSALSSLQGKRFDFIVNVISVSSIPEPYTDRVLCKYFFKKKESKPLATTEKQGSNVTWDYKKRYAFAKFDPELMSWLNGDDCITFEVYGYKKKDGGGDDAPPAEE